MNKMTSQEIEIYDYTIKNLIASTQEQFEDIPKIAYDLIVQRRKDFIALSDKESTTNGMHN